MPISTFPSPEPRWLGGWRCLGTLPFDPGIWTGHTCTPPHCHHAGLPASEFCMIWQTLFSKYNAVSTSETSSDLCHCLKPLPGSQTLPSSPSECSSRPLSGCLPGLLQGPFPSRPLKGISSLLSVEHLLASRSGPTALNAQTLQRVDHFCLSQHPSWQTSSS